MIIGIDPGITGAIAFFQPYSTATDAPMNEIEADFVRDIPTMQRGKSGNAQQVNAAELARILSASPTFTVQHAYVELVKGMPRIKGRAAMGATSAFNFGHTFGSIEAVLQTLAIPYTLVPPERWKKYAGLVGAEKDASRTLAIRRFPTVAHDLARKKDVGRAEALLIGWAGFYYLGSKGPNHGDEPE
jgi:crossover junction endodeoxyribonuclease RuvC